MANLSLKDNRAAIDDHKNDKNNPHGVTPAKIGAIAISEKGKPNGVPLINNDGVIEGKVKDVGDLSSLRTVAKYDAVTAINEAMDNIDNVKVLFDNTQRHVNNKNNPHGVTIEQIGASPLVHNHNNLYYSKSEVDSKIVNSQVGYTKEETDDKFAPKVHNHDGAYVKEKNGITQASRGITVEQGYVEIQPYDGTYGTGKGQIFFDGNNKRVNIQARDASNTIYSPDLYVGGNKVWTSANVGSGSKLDADLLDGKHATDFAPMSHTHNYLSPNTALDMPANAYYMGTGGGKYGIHMKNSDLIGLNALVFNDPCDSNSEGFLFPKTDADVGSTEVIKYDHLKVYNGDLILNGKKAYTEANIEQKLGNHASLKTTEKTSLVGAINELFMSASSGKNLIASAITGKGIGANGNETYQSLADKIGKIETGNKGLLTAQGEGSAYIEGKSIKFQVNGLGFKPSKVLLIRKNVNTTFDFGFAFFIDTGEQLVFNDTNIVGFSSWQFNIEAVSKGNVQFMNTGFNALLASSPDPTQLNSSHVYKWYAYQ